MFKVLKPKETVVIDINLTTTQKKKLTDLFVTYTGNGVLGFLDAAVRANLDYGREAIINSYNKKIAIEKYVADAMKGNIIITPAVVENSVTIEETVYNIVPTTIDDLKTQAFAEFPNCNVTALNYNLDMIIKWSDSDGNGTFEEFKTYF